MYVEKLILKDFRNYKNLEIELDKGINIFKGENAQGKTNLLESIYLCAMGKSYRTFKDSELINWESKEMFLKVDINKEKRVEKINIYMNKDMRKGIKVNDIPIYKLSELLGFINIVNFVPEDLELIKSGPAKRRKFMNIEISQINKGYFENLQRYYRIVKQRNNEFKKKNVSRETLQIWDEQLIEFGVKIIREREKFVKRLQEVTTQIHQNLTNDKEKIEIIYQPNTTEENFIEDINKNFQKELKYKYTYVGPHKDDILIKINGKEAKNYASQGQQRTAILSLKFAQIEIIKETRNETPILLLDDVLSELDDKRQAYMLKYIENMQTILTCTELENKIREKIEIGKIFEVDNGNIIIK